MPQVKKVLITGANGFLGSNVARELFRRGYELKLMMRVSADRQTIDDLPCEIFHGDITDAEDVSKAIKDCHFVIHTASVTQQWNVSFKTYEKINVDGTKHVVQACLDHQIERLIHISTANTIGPGNQHQAGTELNAFTLAHVGSGYISSKYIAQQYVLEQVARNHLPALVINPTFMIGPYDAKPSSGKLILHGLGKRIVFYPPGGKNFVHIQDVCTGIANALDHGKIGNCYLLAGENLSYQEFFQMMNRISGQQPLMIRIPAFILKTAGLIGTLSGLFRRYPARLNYGAAYLLCLYNYYSGNKAERELNISYSPVSSAITQALKWFRENNYC